MKLTKNMKYFIYAYAFFFVFSGLEALKPNPVRNPLSEKNRELLYNAKVGLVKTRLHAISKCGYDRKYFCFRALVENLKDENPEIRQKSAQSLGLLKLPETFKYLEEALKEEKEDSVKRQILITIGYVRNPGSASSVEPFLKDKNDDLRRTAAFSLSNLRDKQSLSSLRSAYKSEKEDSIKVSMLHSILLIDGSDMKERKELVDYLLHEEILVRYSSAKAIQELMFPEAIETLEKALLIENDLLTRRELYQAYMNTIYSY
ncbi:MAG: HEAT repeat domain-containing protein [Spirochaetia bacterium]|nr:HEAT repeat domain-containing protein [Spirochaetia bacterium]